MLNFPANLQHGSGVQMELDPARVLVTLKKPFEHKAFEATAAAAPFWIDDGEAGPHAGREPSPQINHGEKRVWLHARAPGRLDGRLEDLLRAQFGDDLERIAPVYRLPHTEGPGGCVSPQPHVLLVKPTPQAASREGGRALVDTMKAHGWREVPEKSKYLHGFHYFVAARPGAPDAFTLRRMLRAHDAAIVADARFENVPMVVPHATTPNDTLYAQQWDMQRIWAGGAGTTGWNLSTGDSTVTICILDEGVDLTHPDLLITADQGLNLGTMSGNGGPTGNHGTACAGIAAARYNNSLGVAGVAGSCQILPLAFDTWSDAEVAAGITFAADYGARVISMSFRVYAPGEGLEPTGWDFAVIDPAISYAHSRSMVMCAATGNEDANSYNGYPARHPLVIACGASDEADNRKSPSSPDGEWWWGSNFAPGVSVVAPGVHIRTTDRQGTAGYNNASGTAGDYVATFNGTSAATPHVAGLTALLVSRYPALTNVEVRNIIERTAEKVGTVAYADGSGFANGMRNDQMGYGRINVFRALDFADLLIRDWPGDNGIEPSSSPGGNFWDYSDMVIRPTDDNVFEPANLALARQVERGQTNWVYVRVTNNGPREARDVTVNVRMLPWVGTQFVYPQDWALIDAGHVAPTPVSTTFPLIAVGAQVIAKFTLSSAQVEQLWDWTSSHPWHPCTVTEVMAENDYARSTADMSGAPLTPRRNNIAQRNLSVVDVLPGTSASIPFVVGNRFDWAEHLELVIDRGRLPRTATLEVALDEDFARFPHAGLENVRIAPPRADRLRLPDDARIGLMLAGRSSELMLGRGSELHLPGSLKLTKFHARGGEVVLRDEERFFSVRSALGTVKMRKRPQQVYPLALKVQIPSTAKKGQTFPVSVKQRDAAGRIVGGATVVFVVR
jgi:subtilisin family serine protease